MGGIADSTDGKGNKRKCCTQKFWEACERNKAKFDVQEVCLEAGTWCKCSLAAFLSAAWSSIGFLLCCDHVCDGPLTSCRWFSHCLSQVSRVTSCWIPIELHLLVPSTGKRHPRSSPRKAYAVQSHAAVQAEEDRGELACCNLSIVHAEFVACRSQATCGIKAALLCVLPSFASRTWRITTLIVTCFNPFLCFFMICDHWAKLTS